MIDLTNVKLNDRYVIEKPLGRGGMGIVYLAKDTRLNSIPVVVKTLLDGYAINLDEAWVREKFDKEIAALIRINHPGVVGITDLGQMPDGRPFFVMQCVLGVTLRDALTTARFELSRVADIARQLGSALSAAHRVGVTHRDLKPENVMLQTTRPGEEIVRLIDFGIATVLDLQAKQTPARTVVAGTTAYLAPEQLRGEPQAASDIWSLGIIVYEMTTGRVPFATDNLVRLAEMQRAGVTVLPKSLRSDLSQAAQNVILRALNYNPNNRFQQAHEMGDALWQTIDLTDFTPKVTNAMKENIESETGQEPIDGHVLFMDLVRFTQNSMPEQQRLVEKLREIVSKTPTFIQAKSTNLVKPIDTGDGMALVFFQKPVAAVQCALEIASALHANPDIKLRMGLHSGPVQKRRDINENLNVGGSGINFAQRVMDSGDAGHILLSRSVAENLMQLGEWEMHLHDLGVHEVNGNQVHLYNLCKNGLGCADWPSKLPPPPNPSAPVGQELFPLPTKGISYELREQCKAVLFQFDEVSDPSQLRIFTAIKDLELVNRCIPLSATLNADEFFNKLLFTGRTETKPDGRSEFVPALFHLLDALAVRYRDDYRGTQCLGIKEKINGEIAAIPAKYGPS